MSRLLTLFLISLLMNGVAWPQRTHADLSGTWEFRFDPEAAGESQAWYANSAPEGWSAIEVPGSFNEELANDAGHPEPSDKARFYQGVAWYRRQFNFKPIAGEDATLRFGAAVLRQKVWLNGKLLGSSNVAWMDVTYDASALLRKGLNTIVVAVDNRTLAHGIPDARWRGWWNDGGLIRPVILEQRSHVHVDSHVQTFLLPGGQWKLVVFSRITHPAAAVMRLTLQDANGRRVWSQQRKLTQKEGEVETATELSGLAAWTPDHPSLYRLTVAVGKDSETTRVGFRQVEVKGSQILLNGTPLMIRGINRHEFLAGRGQSLTPAQNRADIADLKALGANFTRLAHYSQSQEVYDACDELGLLVWTEIPAWQTSLGTLRDPELMTRDAAPQLTAMVEQHWNHPSVMIYSVANEIPSDQPEGAAYIEKAISLVRSLDPTRLVTFASDKRERDVAMDSVDVVAVNEYFGWYYGALEEVGPMLDAMHHKYPGKPVLVSEFGSESVPGWDPTTAHPDNKGLTKNYSPEYQVKFLTSHMDQIYAPARRSYMAGGVIWVYNDFPDPHRIGGDHPDIAKYRNNKGLVTMERKHKPAYDTVQTYYHQLAGHPAP